MKRVPDAVQRSWRCSAEPRPTSLQVRWTPDQQRAASRCAASGERRNGIRPSRRDRGAAPDCPATSRKQSRHRQSPPSDGIGRRNNSSAHQHGPDRLQVNSVPQRSAGEAARGRGISNRFVMNQAAM